MNAMRKGTRSANCIIGSGFQMLYRGLITATCLFAVATTLPVQAAELYQVELVAFTNESRAYGKQEIWHSDIELTLPQPLQLLRDADGIAAGASADLNLFENLARDNLALKSEAAALSRSGHRILLHSAWLQRIGAIGRAKNIYLEGGNSYSPYHELAGTLRLYRQQFVHVDTNLWLAKFASATPAPASAAATSTTQTMAWPLPPLPPQADNRDDAVSSMSTDAGNPADNLLNKDRAVERIVLLQQHRRLRQNELNYLDHPLFGLLIRVSPYEVTDGAAATPVTADVPAAGTANEARR